MKSTKSKGQKQQAYTYLKLGNDLRKKIKPYDIAEDKELFTHLQSLNQSEALIHPIRAHETHIAPIFIIGMPRSGTTLLERELCKRFEITPLGELPFAEEGIQRIQLDKVASSANLMDLRASYIDRVTRYRKIDGLFIDKMPLNFRFAVLLSRAFRRLASAYFQEPESGVLVYLRALVLTAWDSLIICEMCAPTITYM